MQIKDVFKDAYHQGAVHKAVGAYLTIQQIAPYFMVDPSLYLSKRSVDGLHKVMMGVVSKMDHAEELDPGITSNLIETFLAAVSHEFIEIENKIGPLAGKDKSGIEIRAWACMEKAGLVPSSLEGKAIRFALAFSTAFREMRHWAIGGLPVSPGSDDEASMLSWLVQDYMTMKSMDLPGQGGALYEGMLLPERIAAAYSHPEIDSEDDEQVEKSRDWTSAVSMAKVAIQNMQIPAGAPVDPQQVKEAARSKIEQFGKSLDEVIKKTLRAREFKVQVMGGLPISQHFKAVLSGRTDKLDAFLDSTQSRHLAGSSFSVVCMYFSLVHPETALKLMSKDSGTIYQMMIKKDKPNLLENVRADCIEVANTIMSRKAAETMQDAVLH